MINVALYGGLMSVDNDNKYVPDLAESVDVSDDKLTYTFHLRDTKWSDGQSVTAQDFEYAWKRTADSNAGSQFAYMFENMNVVNGAEVSAGEMDPQKLSVEATDDKTFVVRLKSPTPYIYSIMANAPMAPVRKDFIESKGDKAFTTVDDMLFSGPYKMTSWDPSNNEIVLEKNNNYWDKDNVSVDKITFKSTEDQQSGAMSYENGDLDWVKLTGDLVKQYKDNADFKQELANFVCFFYFNATKFTNEKFRQAIAYAIDRDDICDNVLADGSVAHLNILGDNECFDPDGKDFNDSTTKNYAYDEEKAKGLMKEALSEGAPTEFSLEYDDSDNSYGLVAQYLASKLNSILGLTVNLSKVPRKTRLANLKSGEFDVTLHRWGPDYADPTTNLVCYVKDGVYNYAKWSDPAFEDAYGAAVGVDAADDAKRWDDLVTAEDVLTKSAISIPVYQTGLSTLQRPKITEFVYHLTGAPRIFKYAKVEG